MDSIFGPQLLYGRTDDPSDKGAAADKRGSLLSHPSKNARKSRGFIYASTASGNQGDDEACIIPVQPQSQTIEEEKEDKANQRSCWYNTSLITQTERIKICTSPAHRTRL